jgi:hypothetical protein
MVWVGPPLDPANVDQDHDAQKKEFRDLARRLAVAVATRLEQALDEIGQRRAKRRREQLERLAEMDRRGAHEARLRADAVVKDLLLHGLGELPESVLVQSIGELRKQQQDLELELAGLEARTRALQEQVQAAAKRADLVPQTDEIIKNLRLVVELKTKRLSDLRAARAAGQVSQDEVNRGEVDVISSKVELAQAERTAALGPAQELRGWNAELAKAAVSTAECQAKLKYVREQLEKNVGQWQNESQMGQRLREQLGAANKLANSLWESAVRRELEGEGDVAHPATVEIYAVPPAKQPEAQAEPQPADAEKKTP